MIRSLNILWLYPDLMSTYGDRGNIIVLTKRCQWRGIEVNILENNIEKADLIFMGGAQDRQQKLVSRDLFSKKGEILRKKIEQGIPGLFICGAYQFLGHYYLPAQGNKIPGLSIFDVYTRHFGLEKPRAIGNIVVDWEGTKLVGFENHGGRTYLGEKVKPFGKVLKGHGNSGEDKTEGAVYKNSYGTYLHGPILPKNPELADFLIQKALEVKYKKEIKLTELDDSLELQAKKSILEKL